MQHVRITRPASRANRLISKAVLALLLVPVFLLPATSAEALACPAPGPGGTSKTYSPVGRNVAVNVNADVQFAPENSVFCFDPGTYYLSSNVAPKTGDQFIGLGTDRTQVRLTGSVDLGNTGWTNVDSDTWKKLAVSGLALNQHQVAPGHCNATAPNCAEADDVVVTSGGIGTLQKRQVVPPTACSGPALGVNQSCIDYVGRYVWIGTSPAGKTVEYTERTTGFNSGSANTRFENLTVDRFQDYGIVMGSDLTVGGTLVDVQVSWVHGVGLSMGQRDLWGSSATNVRVSYNGFLGFSGGGGIFENSASGTYITDSESDHNNQAGYNCGWACSIKFAETNWLILINSDFHDNLGDGIWFDVDNYGAAISNNTVTNNVSYTGTGRARGIHYEISCYGTITDNIVTGNGEGIMTRNTDFTFIGSNTITANATTSKGIQLYAGQPQPPGGLEGGRHCGPLVYGRGNEVVNNTINYTTGAPSATSGLTTYFPTQIAQPCGPDGLTECNSFGLNHWHIPTSQNCGAGTGARKTWRWWDGGAYVSSLPFFDPVPNAPSWQGFGQDPAPDGTCVADQL